MRNVRQHMEDMDDSFSPQTSKEREDQPQQEVLRERQQSAQAPQVQFDNNARQEEHQKQRDSDGGVRVLYKIGVFAERRASDCMTSETRRRLRAETNAIQSDYHTHLIFAQLFHRDLE